ELSVQPHRTHSFAQDPLFRTGPTLSKLFTARRQSVFRPVPPLDLRPQRAIGRHQLRRPLPYPDIQLPPRDVQGTLCLLLPTHIDQRAAAIAGTSQLEAYRLADQVHLPPPSRRLQAELDSQSTRGSKDGLKVGLEQLGTEEVQPTAERHANDLL